MIPFKKARKDVPARSEQVLYLLTAFRRQMNRRVENCLTDDRALEIRLPNASVAQRKIRRIKIKHNQT